MVAVVVAMSDDPPAPADASPVDRKSMEEYDLAPSVSVTFQKTDDGLIIEAFETSDGYESLWCQRMAEDFYESPQNRGIVVNRIVDNLPPGIDGSAVEDELRSIFSDFQSGMSAQGIEELCYPVVGRILDETEKVEYLPAEELTIRVTLTHAADTRSIEFTSGEYDNLDPSKFRQRYLNEFYERIDLNADHWEQLRDAWDDQAERREREELTERDRIYHAVMRKLASERVKVYADRDYLWRDKWNVWFDPDNAMVDDSIPEDEAVVWVGTETLTAILEDMNKDPEFMSSLSPMLLDNGDTFTTSREKSQGYVYPFKPESVGVHNEDLHVRRPGEEEETEVGV